MVTCSRYSRAGAAVADQVVVDVVVQRVVLGHLAADADVDERPVRGAEDRREVEAVGLPVADRIAGAEQVDATDQVVDGADAKRRHDLPRLLGDEEEVVDDVLGRAVELLAELLVLGADADGAGVEVALAHHDAADGDQRRGGEAVLLRAEAGGNDNVAAGLEPAVGFETDAGAEVVGDEGLVGLGEAELPGQARVLDAGERGSAGAAVVAGDEDVVGLGLGDAGGDGADADLRDELDRNNGLGVAPLKVEDELGQVLDRVDVVVGRGADKADPGRGVADRGYIRIDLEAGELAALAGFGALGDLDLELVGVGEVVRCDAEAARGDLLDGGAA